ncbi:carbohydrate porin [Granulicella cerasi]|uniref:Carbohydrate porin n=1 Tax=Granulicella cerasi TaxID=741063 RepID=A0ABW1ZBS1_9BACT|nr:carbohydrate porin [Granulicella cerasi]
MSLHEAQQRILTAGRKAGAGVALLLALSATGAAAQQSNNETQNIGQQAQAEAQTKPAAPDYSHPGGRNIEDLNLRGTYLKLPPFSEMLFGEKNPVRQALAKQGIGLFDIDDNSFSYNVTAPPVPLAQQTYNGQRPTWKSSHYPAFTWDLRQLGIRGGQLLIMGTVQKISWNAGGPNAIEFGNISYYQSLFHDKLELKGGYIDNDFEFVGTAIGGQASSGSLGVFASLPFEVGMSYLPMTTPAFNVNYHWNKNFYTKFSFQRSMDPKGGVEEARRDTIGLRFKPKGDGLLTIYEGGYQHESDQTHYKTWLRGGYMYNTTHFTNLKTGGTSTNNYLGYVLADRQLWKADKAVPYRGLYAGFTAMDAPATQNSYSQYYELRAYMLSPFARRPQDMASIVSSHTTYSPYAKYNAIAAGQKYWNSATSLTGSYTARMARGLYLSPGVSYTNGPQIAPKSKSSVTLLIQAGIFF